MSILGVLAQDALDLGCVVGRFISDELDGHGGDVRLDGRQLCTGV